MNSKIEQQIRNQLFSNIDQQQFDAFVKAVDSLYREIAKLAQEAIEPMEKTIKNCFGLRRVPVSNIVQFDYILRRAAKKVLESNQRNTKQTRIERNNALKAQSLIFNQYRFSRIYDKFFKIFGEFKENNKEILQKVENKQALGKILPNYDKFLDQVIDSCEDLGEGVTLSKVKAFLRNYNAIYTDLFVKHSPSKQVIDESNEMIDKLKGNSKFSFTYNPKTGQLTGLPEVVLGDMDSIEEADNALNYYVAFSEYFEKQKVAIGLQLASNRHFAKSICYPYLLDSFTDMLKKPESVITDKYFNKYFNSLSPNCFDDIETIKSKSMALDKVRSMLVSAYSYMEIAKRTYIKLYREENHYVDEISDDTVLKDILFKDAQGLYEHLREARIKIDDIIKIHSDKPILDEADITKRSKALTKFISERLTKVPPELSKEYVKLSLQGYTIAVPDSFDISEVRAPSVKVLMPNREAVKPMPSQITFIPKRIEEVSVVQEPIQDIGSYVQGIINETFADTIGLVKLKEDLFERVCALKILPKGSELRELTFLLAGNPGSGKTMSAKKIHEVLYRTGILSEDKIYDDIAAALKAPYVGQTVVNIEKIFKEYQGGTIFIDEADSLFNSSNGKEDQFTGEARSKFIKRVEEDCKDTAIIMACYKDRLQPLFQSNPGIFRRFSGGVITLEDYTAEELLQMCELKLKIDAEKTNTQPYVFSAEAQKELKGYFEYINARAKGPEHKENGGVVKRTLLGVLSKKAIRSSIDREISFEDVRGFIDEDEAKKVMAEPNRIIGFGKPEQC